MKKILLLGLFLLFATVSSSFASFIDSGISLTGAYNSSLTWSDHSSLAWGDYDNDGDLDLAVSGRGTLGYTTTIYQNIGGAFTDIGAGLTGVYLGSLAWGDYDNDGDLDLAVCGYTGAERIAKIYRNDSGTFTDIGADLTGVIYSSLAWGDYDNDGDLDLAVSGMNAGGIGITKIYRNDSGTFTDIGAGLTGVWYSSLAWGDYDNDGYLDLAMSGWAQGAVYTAKIYRNTGGTFTDIGAGLTGVYVGSLAWGDYDNDGDLDLAVCGDSVSGKITKIYQNTGGTFTDIGAGLTGVYHGSLAWGDYDNDGDLDLAVCGHDGSVGTTKIYRNDSGAFTDIGAGLTGIYFSSLAWGDYDNDGDLDLAVCGYTGAERIAKIYKNLEADSAGNNNPNLAPSPPTNLTYQAGSTILKWNPGSDSETQTDGLYYNLRVGTTSGGNDIVSGVYGSPLMGNYLRPKLSGSQLGVRLGDLPSGTYYWNVQTIDTGLMKSAWSEEASFSNLVTFTVSASVSGGHGSVSPESQDILSGEGAAIDIVPDAGYHIAGITDNGSPVTIANPYIITSVTATHTVVVAFAIDTFTVSASVSGGHGTVNPLTQPVDYGGTATIDIIPDAGYHIAGITDNGSPVTIANPYIITSVTAAHTVVVAFSNDVSISGFVRTSSTGSGIAGVTITFTGKKDKKAATITATADTGADGFYTVSVPYGWTGSAVPAKAGYKFSSPNHRNYKNLSANRVNQNYTGRLVAGGKEKGDKEDEEDEEE